MLQLNHPLLPLRVRRFATRFINFVRPRPRTMPLTVEQILGSTAGRELVDRFVDLYYRAGTAPSMSYQGMPILKNPCDVWMIVELLERLRPTAVVETGTHYGGSAVYFADMLRLLGIEAPVVTIDFNPKWSLDPDKRGVTSLVGYSTDPAIVARVQMLVAARQRARPGQVLVLLDSDHSCDNVLQELRLYGPLVTRDSYLIVEDTHVNGHPSFPDHGPGPWEAVDQFLAETKDFEADRACERFLLTFNPRGWLKRKSGGEPFSTAAVT
jgi:cephalosporin hydroxylase